MIRRYRNVLIAASIGLVFLVIVVFLATGSGKNSDGGASNSVKPESRNTLTAYEDNGIAPPAAEQLPQTGSEQDTVTKDVSKAKTNTAKQRKIILTGSMEIETTKFDAAVSAIASKIQSIGGYIEGSDITGIKSENGNYLENRTATYTLRIPSDKFTGFMNQIGSIGVVTSKHSGGQDVTSEYIDTEARLTSMKIKEARLNAILKKAEKLADILAIETELENTRYEIESLTSSLKKWDNLVSYSTLTLSVRETTQKKLLVKKPVTMTDKLKNAFNGSIGLLSDIAKGLLVAIVAFLPFAVILAILLAAVLFILKRTGRKGSDE